MLDKFIFENHLGIRFDGLANGVYLNYSELRDYSWSYDTINGRISRFFRPVTARKIPLVVKCKSADEAKAVINKLHELSEADIFEKLPGKIFVGEYYTIGFITASKKAEYLISKKYCKIELTLTSNDPVWYKDKTYQFFAENGRSSESNGGYDFPYDHNYDYSASGHSEELVLDSSISSNDFRLCIYGEVVNPSITIGDHLYSVTGTVGENEKLIIDSQTKTITLISANGKKTNWFNNRNRDSYIFQPIPHGKSSVSWNGTFGFDLTVIEKRSEPKWI